MRGFPGGPLVKNPPANAGDRSSLPDLGRPPRAMEQLSLCTTTTQLSLYNYRACALEPGSHNYWSQHALEPMLGNKGRHRNGSRAPHIGSGPHSPQLEKNPRPVETQHNQKYKKRRMINENSQALPRISGSVAGLMNLHQEQVVYSNILSTLLIQAIHGRFLKWSFIFI